MSFILDERLRERSLSLYYMKKRINPPTYSIMRTKEELLQDFLEISRGETPHLSKFPPRDIWKDMFLEVWEDKKSS
jgi:hypothetical protein